MVRYLASAAFLAVSLLIVHQVTKAPEEDQDPEDIMAMAFPPRLYWTHRCPHQDYVAKHICNDCLNVGQVFNFARQRTDIKRMTVVVNPRMEFGAFMALRKYWGGIDQYDEICETNHVHKLWGCRINIGHQGGEEGCRLLGINCQNRHWSSDGHFIQIPFGKTAPCNHRFNGNLDWFNKLTPEQIYRLGHERDLDYNRPPGQLGPPGPQAPQFRITNSTFHDDVIGNFTNDEN